MDARWFLRSCFAAVLFTVAQGQVIGRMRHVASPNPESCTSLDDLFALLSLARALEEKSTGRQSCTYCPDDVIVNLVNALVFTATAHVCPEPWSPTSQCQSQIPYPTHPSTTTCPPVTSYPPTTTQPTVTHPPPATHPTTGTYPPTTTNPPNTNQPSTSFPPTIIDHSNTSDYSMNPVDNGDHNQNGNSVGINKNSQVVVVVDGDGNHHSGDDVNGKNHINADNSDNSRKGNNDDADSQAIQAAHEDGGQKPKGTEDIDYKQYTADVGAFLGVNAGEKKVKFSKSTSGDDKESKSKL